MIRYIKMLAKTHTACAAAELGGGRVEPMIELKTLDDVYLGDNKTPAETLVHYTKLGIAFGKPAIGRPVKPASLLTPKQLAKNKAARARYSARPK